MRKGACIYIHVRDYPLKDIEHFSLSDSYQILQYIFKYHNEHKYIFNCWCKWNVGQFMKMDACLSCSFVLARVWMVWIHSTAASVHARACTHTHTPFTCTHTQACAHTHAHTRACLNQTSIQPLHWLQIIFAQQVTSFSNFYFWGFLVFNWRTYLHLLWAWMKWGPLMDLVFFGGGGGGGGVVEKRLNFCVRGTPPQAEDYFETAGAVQWGENASCGSSERV